MSTPLNECSACGQDLAGVTYFDAHRVGDHGPGEYGGPVEDWSPVKGRRCLTVDELQAKGYVLDSRGRWNPKRAEGLRAHHASKQAIPAVSDAQDGLAA